MTTIRRNPFAHQNSNNAANGAHHYPSDNSGPSINFNSYDTGDRAAADPQTASGQQSGQSGFFGAGGNSADLSSAFAGMSQYKPLANIGLEATKNLSNSLLNRYISTANMRFYFDVNNEYVLRKLAIVLCPFLVKGGEWRRKLSDNVQNSHYLSPKDDVNAADLYIPLMSFTTFILMLAFNIGTGREFHPDLLGITASKGFGMVFFEVIILKFIFHLLVANTSFLELLALCSYKFVGLVVTQIAGAIFGDNGYYLALIYSSLMMGFFMFKSLKQSSQMNSVTQNMESLGQSKDYVLYGAAFMQLPIAWYLGHY